MLTGLWSVAGATPCVAQALKNAVSPAMVIRRVRRASSPKLHVDDATGILSSLV